MAQPLREELFLRLPLWSAFNTRNFDVPVVTDDVEIFLMGSKYVCEDFYCTTNSLVSLKIINVGSWDYIFFAN